MKIQLETRNTVATKKVSGMKRGSKVEIHYDFAKNIVKDIMLQNRPETLVILEPDNIGPEPMPDEWEAKGLMEEFEEVNKEYMEEFEEVNKEYEDFFSLEGQVLMEELEKVTKEYEDFLSLHYNNT